MKIRYVLLMVSFFTLISAKNIFAADEASITLTTPHGLISQVCKTPIWKTKVVWGGVTDKRAEPEVGVQTQKGKEPIPILSSPPIAQILGDTLQKLLPACGMSLDAKGDDAVKISVEVREFYVGVEKKLITGKSRAVSSLAFLATQHGRSSSVVIGSEIESKKIRSGNIKQLKQTLDELFAETIKQIPTSEEMKRISE